MLEKVIGRESRTERKGFEAERIQFTKIQLLECSEFEGLWHGSSVVLEYKLSVA